MTSYVPFPFTDWREEKNRPALVISDAAAFNRPAGLSVMAMITSAEHAPWPLDVPIGDLKAAGLPAPSLVRFKIFTLDHRPVRGKLGRLAGKDQQRRKGRCDACCRRQAVFGVSRLDRPGAMPYLRDA